MRNGLYLKFKKWLCLKRGFTKVNLPGLNRPSLFHVSSNLEYKKCVSLDGEFQVLDRFLGSIQYGDTVYDIGANMGLFSIPAAIKLRSHGRVIAFEPVPKWSKRLRKNILLNGLDNVDLHEVGLFDQYTNLPIHLKDVLGSGMGSIKTGYVPLIDGSLKSEISISLVPGHEFIQEHQLPMPNAVKIDVEGAELEVLKGLSHCLSQSSCRLILCEVHPTLLECNSGDVEDLIQSFGYELKVIGERKNEYHLLATR